MLVRYSDIPKTGFDCRLTKYPGFYADIDTGCQVSVIAIQIESSADLLGAEATKIHGWTL